MASLLRQMVAGPRARHPEAGLDLCYVTDNIIVTSGPSQTYPQRAYRNPLDRVVAFLDSKHGANWAIWEFRAEGTGYPDDLVYNRVQHYPWPDHHPPPFRLIPMIVAGMRNWLNGNDLDLDLGGDDNNSARNSGAAAAAATATATSTEAGSSPLDGQDHQKENDKEKERSNKKSLASKIVDTWKDAKKTDRVVVVHCKAGKGRSGTVACSYLIAECGWTPEQALARFTERRMRPKMGPGVSIPSQLRTIGYVERWARSGNNGNGGGGGGKGQKRVYVERPIEIVEIHVWGLRNGVKVAVEGYADEGKSIQVLHTFSKRERHVVDGAPPGGAGVVDMVYDMAGYNSGSSNGAKPSPVPAEQEPGEAIAADLTVHPPSRTATPSSSKSVKSKVNKRASTIISKVSRSASKSGRKSSPTTGLDTKPVTAATTTAPAPTANGFAADSSPSASISTSTSTSIPAGDRLKNQLEAQSDAGGGGSSNNSDTLEEPGGRAVIFKPRTPIRVPTSDVNITVERRNRAPRSVGLTMVTAVAHVWFNAFFEGNGPEQGGRADPHGVFEIDWDRMDGIKGSSQKGTRAADRFAVVWRVAASEGGGGEGRVESKVQGELIEQPGVDSPVPQMRAADWKSAGGGGGDGSRLQQQQQNPDAQKHLGLRLKSPEDSAENVSRASSVIGNEDGVSSASTGTSTGKGGVDAEGVIGEIERRSADAAEDARELRSVRSDVSGGVDGDGLEDGLREGEGRRSRLRAYADKLPRPGGSG